MEDDNLINNPKLAGHGCVMSAHGRGFEPSLFLKETTLPAEVILAYGKLGMPEELRQKIIESEGLEGVALFDAKILALRLSESGVHAVQYKDAIEFLSRYRDEILRLSRFPNVEQVNLRCVAAEGESFEERPPDELLEIGAQCGLTGLM